MFKIFATPTGSYFQAQVLPHASQPVSPTVVSVLKLGLLPFRSLSHIDLCPQCFHGNTKPFPNISTRSLGKLSHSQSTHPWASSFVPFPILMQVCLHPVQLCLYLIQVCLHPIQMCLHPVQVCPHLMQAVSPFLTNSLPFITVAIYRRHRDGS